METRFERVTVEVKSHADAKNVALSRKLGGLSEMLEIKVITNFTIRKRPDVNL